MPRNRSRAVTMFVLAALTVAACSSGHPGTPGSARAGSSPGANAAPTPSGDVTRAAGGGAFCDVVRTSLAAMRPLSEDLFRNPANTKGNWDGIVKQWQAMAAVAPPELGGDFQVIVDSWNRAGDEAAKGGWDLLSLARALGQQMSNDAFQQAYEHQARYVQENAASNRSTPPRQGNAETGR
jgi:hypothetical protein